MFLTKNHAIYCNTVKVMVKSRGKITPSGRFCHQYSRRVKLNSVKLNLIKGHVLFSMLQQKVLSGSLC